MIYVYSLMLKEQLHGEEAFAAFMEVTLILLVGYSVVINILLSLRHLYYIFPVRFFLFFLVMRVDQSDYKFLVVHLFEPFVASHIHLLVIGFLEYLYAHVTCYV